MDFFPLHVYTGYSFLKSGLSLPAYVALCKKKGQSFCCVSDYQTMTGFPELTDLCAQAGLKPVYAMDLSVEGYLFTAIVLSEQGYMTLIELNLMLSKGEISLAELKNHTLGLAFILDLSVPKLIDLSLEGKSAYATALSSVLKGMGNVYLGIPYMPSRHEYVSFIKEFVAQYPYETVAFPHVRYAKPEDAIALSIVEAIDSDGTLTEKHALGTQCYLDEGSLTDYYSPGELSTPLKIASLINFTFAKRRGKLPTYPNPSGEDSRALLRRASHIGLNRRLPNHGKEYEERLEYELSVIEKMGYCDYFLIVADYVSYAKKHGISVGPGRGSSAGSLVAFALGIVTPDPLKYGLLFERFLNPDRQSMPDIDVDFCDVRRDEVVHYLQEKYGHDRVAHIVTMQTLGAKASIRDIGRVYGYEPRHIDMLAKAIGKNTLTLRQNYRQNPAFRSLVDSDSFYLEIVTLASKIEGLPRQAGLHAAGIVLSEEPLSHIIPVTENPGVGLVAQYEMNHLEEQGVLKMDLLGLRNLTIVDHCLELIEATHGTKLDYATLPYEDPDAIKLIAAGKTLGLFQLESAGMNRAIMSVKPTLFTDVVAIIALFRPGPMENIPSFGRRKAGKEKITYPSPVLEPYLKETYGIIVYQEQVMQCVRALAGFSFAEADSFRRAVSKKDAKKLESLKEGFIAGCVNKGTDPKVAENLYEVIFKFAGYGFNKSHAVVYTILTCQMAYLKAHYPLEFYCAILDDTSSGDPKFAALSHEIKSSGYRFALPSINKASYRFTPDGKTIVFPLTAVKSLQGALTHKIIEERELGGAYKDIFDFALRNKKNGLTLLSLVKLIDAGCFDEFGYNRARLRLAADSAIRYAENFAGESGQELLLGFDFPKPEIPMAEATKMDDLLAERECLGVMVSGSPLESKAEEIRAQGLRKLSELSPSSQEAYYAAVVSSCKAVTTKKGTRMAFLTLYDEEAVVEVALFAETYDQCYPLLKDGTLIKASIYPNKRREGYCAAKIERL
ncbi:MAG: DNA polymerase III subunit alpha [Erysipelotrichaceae bacterium]|nr:DNA polymerase III subunit alpha [Erysipelotrichaceae bacterium]